MKPGDEFCTPERAGVLLGGLLEGAVMNNKLIVDRAHPGKTGIGGRQLEEIRRQFQADGKKVALVVAQQLGPVFFPKHTMDLAGHLSRAMTDHRPTIFSGQAEKGNLQDDIQQADEGKGASQKKATKPPRPW